MLLPFVAGMALAYLLDPLTRRVERTGLGRGLSALIVIAVIIVAVVLVISLVAPILADQLFAFVDNIPKYMERLQALISGSNREWLNKVFGAPGRRHRQVGRRADGAGRELARGVPRFAVVGRPRAGLGVLAA